MVPLQNCSKGIQDLFESNLMFVEIRNRLKTGRQLILDCVRKTGLALSTDIASCYSDSY